MSTKAFVTESNMIEGIHRPPTEYEMSEHERFTAQPDMTIEQLERFVSIYQPDARLRDAPGLDVRVGNHIPPKGGQNIRISLEILLDCIADMSPYEAHVAYETLHPFTDGNGRSGRALWAWHMNQIHDNHPPTFLHQFYYQALQGARK